MTQWSRRTTIRGTACEHRDDMRPAVIAPALVAMLALAACAPPASAPATAPPASPPTRAAPSASVTRAGPAVVDRVEVIATGLEAPWAIDVAPDGRLFLTERTGRVR